MATITVTFPAAALTRARAAASAEGFAAVEDWAFDLVKKACVAFAVAQVPTAQAKGAIEDAAEADF